MIVEYNTEPCLGIKRRSGYWPLLLTISEETSVHGIDVSNLDMEVSPKDDFYGFACGGWMKRHPLTPEYSRFGTFDQLRENAREQLRNLITNLKDHPESSKRARRHRKCATFMKWAWTATVSIERVPLR